MKLNVLFSGFSVAKDKKVLGRGIGCGKGKTSGRGHKGQKARSGVSINGFEGGQQSIYTRLPKRGFNSINRKKYVVVDLSRVQDLIDRGLISQGQVICKEFMCKLGLISSESKLVKILGKSKLSLDLEFHCDAASNSAKNLIKFVQKSLSDC